MLKKLSFTQAVHGTSIKNLCSHAGVLSHKLRKHGALNPGILCMALEVFLMTYQPSTWHFSFFSFH